jgi:formylglycine-generating enzyme required for sulfatase activity
MREKQSDGSMRERTRELTLAPYFIGRTEVPQSVWERVMGSNPALRQPPAADEAHYTPKLPVEYVDWNECLSFLARLELLFPTEAQWERAARAGEAEPSSFGVGDDAAELEGRENVYDRSAPALEGFVQAPFEDGFELTAPIASFAPNRFGLHDMLGNVTEWCADPYVKRLPDSVTRPDGLVEAQGAGPRVFRGGSYYHQLPYCQLDLRQNDFPRGANQTRGLRVARPVR